MPAAADHIRASAAARTPSRFDSYLGHPGAVGSGARAMHAHGTRIALDDALPLEASGSRLAEFADRYAAMIRRPGGSSDFDIAALFDEAGFDLQRESRRMLRENLEIFNEDAAPADPAVSALFAVTMHALESRVSSEDMAAFERAVAAYNHRVREGSLSSPRVGVVSVPQMLLYATSFGYYTNDRHFVSRRENYLNLPADYRHAVTALLLFHLSSHLQFSSDEADHAAAETLIGAALDDIEKGRVGSPELRRRLLISLGAYAQTTIRIQVEKRSPRGAPKRPYVDSNVRQLLWRPQLLAEALKALRESTSSVYAPFEASFITHYSSDVARMGLTLEEAWFEPEKHPAETGEWISRLNVSRRRAGDDPRMISDSPAEYIEEGERLWKRAIDESDGIAAPAPDAAPQGSRHGDFSDELRAILEKTKVSKAALTKLYAKIRIELSPGRRRMLDENLDVLSEEDRGRTIKDVYTRVFFALALHALENGKTPAYDDMKRFEAAVKIYEARRTAGDVSSRLGPVSVADLLLLATTHGFYKDEREMAQARANYAKLPAPYSHAAVAMFLFHEATHLHADYDESDHASARELTSWAFEEIGSGRADPEMRRRLLIGAGMYARTVVEARGTPKVKIRSFFAFEPFQRHPEAAREAYRTLAGSESAMFAPFYATFITEYSSDVSALGVTFEQLFFDQGPHLDKIRAWLKTIPLSKTGRGELAVKSRNARAYLRDGEAGLEEIIHQDPFGARAVRQSAYYDRFIASLSAPDAARMQKILSLDLSSPAAIKQLETESGGKIYVAETEMPPDDHALAELVDFHPHFGRTVYLELEQPVDVDGTTVAVLAFNGRRARYDDRGRPVLYEPQAGGKLLTLGPDGGLIAAEMLREPAGTMRMSAAERRFETMLRVRALPDRAFDADVPLAVFEENGFFEGEKIASVLTGLASPDVRLGAHPRDGVYAYSVRTGESVPSGAGASLERRLGEAIASLHAAGLRHGLLYLGNAGLSKDALALRDWETAADLNPMFRAEGRLADLLSPLLEMQRIDPLGAQDLVRARRSVADFLEGYFGAKNVSPAMVEEGLSGVARIAVLMSQTASGADAASGLDLAVQFPELMAALHEPLKGARVVRKSESYADFLAQLTPPDGAWMVQILSSDLSSLDAIRDLESRSDGRIYIAEVEMRNGRGRTVYFDLEKPALFDGRQIRTLAFNGRRAARGAAEMPPHDAGGSGRMLDVDEQGRLISRPSIPQPNGGMTLKEANLRFDEHVALAALEDARFAVDAAIAVLDEGVEWNGQRLGSIVLGLEDRDLRFLIDRRTGVEIFDRGTGERTRKTGSGYERRIGEAIAAFHEHRRHGAMYFGNLGYAAGKIVIRDLEISRPPRERIRAQDLFLDVLRPLIELDRLKFMGKDTGAASSAVREMLQGYFGDDAVTQAMVQEGLYGIRRIGPVTGTHQKQYADRVEGTALDPAAEFPRLFAAMRARPAADSKPGPVLKKGAERLEEFKEGDRRSSGSRTGDPLLPSRAPAALLENESPFADAAIVDLPRGRFGPARLALPADGGSLAVLGEANTVPRSGSRAGFAEVDAWRSLLAEWTASLAGKTGTRRLVHRLDDYAADEAVFKDAVRAIGSLLEIAANSGLEIQILFTLEGRPIDRLPDHPLAQWALDRGGLAAWQAAAPFGSSERVIEDYSTRAVPAEGRGFIVSEAPSAVPEFVEARNPAAALAIQLELGDASPAEEGDLVVRMWRAAAQNPAITPADVEEFKAGTARAVELSRSHAFKPLRAKLGETLQRMMRGLAQILQSA